VRLILLALLVVAASVALTVVATGQEDPPDSQGAPDDAGNDAASEMTDDAADESVTSDNGTTVRTGQHGHQFDATVDCKLTGQYLLFLPEQYGRDDIDWPLIVFLHGSGERGRNLDRVRIHGPPKVAPKQPGFPFLVLSPQCPKGKWWQDVDVTLMVMSMIDEVVKAHDVDPDRIYLTGLSMGGFGTWSIAQQYPDRFAALAPVCGGGNPYLQNRLKDVPAWAFHGRQDKNVPLAFAQQMAGALKSAGGDVRLSVYPDLGHDVWTPTYDNPKLYEWFLEHRRPGAR
jgi:predicted peptidase